MSSLNSNASKIIFVVIVVIIFIWPVGIFSLHVPGPAEFLLPCVEFLLKCFVIAKQQLEDSAEHLILSFFDSAEVYLHCGLGVLRSHIEAEACRLFVNLGLPVLFFCVTKHA